MRLATFATAIVVAFGATLPVQAQTDITISQWTSPKHPVAKGYAPLIKKLGENGFNVKSFSGGALLGAKAALAGIGDGVADMGMLAMTYFPAEFPNAQLVADMGLATPDNLTAMAAATEYNLLDCPACLNEYKAANTLYLGTYSTAPYAIISTMPIRSTADLAGKKMRVPGSLWSRWAQSVNGIEVNVPSSEMFEGLDKGALDIAIQAPGAFRSYQLWDVAKYLTKLNLGTYHSLSLMTTNRDWWASLSADQRKLIVDNAAQVAVDTTIAYTNTDTQVMGQLAEHGVELIQPSDAMKADKQAFITADVPVIVSKAKSTYGVENAAEKVKTLQGLIDKWQAIVQETGGDRDAMIAKMNQEIFSKLPANYGLN